MLEKWPREKRCSMGKRLTNTINSKKKTQFGKVAKFPILQTLSKSYKNWLLTHIRDILGQKRLKIHLILKKWHFEKWQKWPFSKGCSKAKSSKVTYLGDEFRRSRIMQKVTLNTHRDVLWEKQFEKPLVSFLKTAKIGHFAKAIASQNGQKRSLLSFNF